MKRILTTLALLCFAAAASATYCASNTLHPGAGAPIWPDHCNDGPTPPVTPTPAGNTVNLTGGPTTATATGGTARSDAAAKAAAAARAQSQAQSASTANGNGVGNGNGNGSGNATTQSTTVNTGAAPGSGTTYNALSVSMPDAPPAIAPTMVAGNITATHLGCGALVREVAEPVFGYDKGLFGGETQRVIGQRVSFMPYLDANGNMVPYLIIGDSYWGHEILRESASLSISSGASLSIAGFGEHGGGSGGGGTSSGMTAMAGDYSVRLCFIGKVAAPVVVSPTPPVHAPVRRPVHRKVAASPCVANAVAACRRVLP